MQIKAGKQDQYKNLIKFAFTVIIWGILTFIWAITWVNYYHDITFRPFGYKGNWMVYLVYSILLFVFTSFYGGYQVGYYRREDVTFSSILGLFFANAITWLQLCLIGAHIVSPLPLLLMSVLQSIVIAIWAFVTNRAYTSFFPPHQMLMVYGGSHLAKSLIHKMIGRSEKYAINEVVNISAGDDALCKKISEYDAVILCDVPARLRNHLIKYCFEHSIRTYTTPKISDILIRGAFDINLFDTPLLLNRNQGLTMEQKIAKRTVDLVCSGIMLLIAMPFMLLTAMAIKIYDRGPVIYKQERLTIEGRSFYIYKFRSMIVDAEKISGIMLSTKKDSRITPVGKFIRMTRLDELPQLINIFKGDMSLVGPRPERPEIYAKYLEQMPEFAYRLTVKAGLTGYAQVVGRYNTTPYDKLKMDLMYIVAYSLKQDFKLLMMTIKILFVRTSTEGIAEGAKDAASADIDNEQSI